MKERDNEMIIDGRGCTYLGEFMDDLPKNVMLNKVTTGCGMTSVVLKNEVKYVLAVPYVALIENKILWCKEKDIDVCAIYGGNGEKEVLAFTGDKIITTYDSLGKVTRALEQRGDIKDWKICIDEAHKLVDSAAFRTGAIRTVLNSYSKYKSYVFGTATPVKDKYQLPELNYIRKARIDWGNLTQVNVNYCPYNSNINEVAAILAIDYIAGIRSGNAHIFINSVNSICNVIRKMKKGGYDKPDQIRIICADNPRNQNVVKQKLSSDYFISPVSSDVKKVNFYTATAFEGCDIYDEDGHNYIITDGSKDHTKIDIATVLPQIIGRVRNSKYKNVVSLFYTPNQYFSNVTEKEFEQFVKQNIKEAKKDVEEFNSLRPESSIRKKMIEANDSAYLLVEEGQLYVNQAAWYNEMHNFSTLRQTYYVSKDGSKSTIQNGMKNNNGIDYQYNGVEKIEIKGLNKVKLGQKASFKDKCIDYIKIKENGYFIFNMADDHLLIEEAYEKLGADRMKALKYRKSAINEALLIQNNIKSVSHKIVKILQLQNGKWFTKEEIKSKIQEVYDKLNLLKKAKSTDLQNWFDIEPCNKRVNKKLINGIKIISCKIKTN